MDKNDKKLAIIRELLEDAENKISSVKRILFEQVYQEQAENLETKENGSCTVIEGIFDGQEMIDNSGKKYQVPENYCSKSKLVAGDSLKLSITSDGTFIFKQIGPVDRKRIVGKLIKKGETWHVDCENKKYQVLPASVSYFKGDQNDRVTVILPKIGESNWAAIENLIEKD